MNQKLRTIFMGTPEFGVKSLRALKNDPVFDIIAIITQPDKRIGRKQVLTKTVIKQEAEKYDIPVLQPEKIKEIKEKIEELNPDIMVVIAYGQIIPENILNIPTHGSINIHASLLPKYRGSACLQAPILNGDKETGITIMRMDKGMDTGPIIFQSNIDLDQTETVLDIHDRLAELGSRILPETLKKYVKGELTAQPQNNEEATYVKIMEKEDGKIDWNDTAENIERKVRALNPWPGTYCLTENNVLLKILEVEHEIIQINKDRFRIGELIDIEGRLVVKTKKGSLVINKLQLEGKKAISSSEFIKGSKKLVNSILK